MATLEAEDTPSCSISRTDERLLQEHGLDNNGISPLFSRLLKRYDRTESLKEKKRRFDSGQINLGTLLKEIEEL